MNRAPLVFGTQDVARIVPKDQKKVNNTPNIDKNDQTIYKNRTETLVSAIRNLHKEQYMTGKSDWVPGENSAKTLPDAEEDTVHFIRFERDPEFDTLELREAATHRASCPMIGGASTMGQILDLWMELFDTFSTEKKARLERENAERREAKDKRLAALAAETGLEIVDPVAMVRQVIERNPRSAVSIPREMCERLCIIPVAFTSEGISIAMTKYFHPTIREIEVAELIPGRKTHVTPMLADGEDIREAIKIAFGCIPSSP